MFMQKISFSNNFHLFQLQHIQQQLQAAVVATANQHQQSEQVATASGGLITLHHATGGSAGLLAPQLLLTSQTTPSFTAYPINSGSQHTSIQQVLQHHVRQARISQSTIQQLGTQQTQHTFSESSNGIITTGNNKCISIGTPNLFPSRSLSQSPQHQVITSQPIIQQVMTASGPVLQLYQPTSRTTTISAAAITSQKNKPPQQILPKPINAINHTQQASGTLLLNQVISNGGMIVGQQTTSGVQVILKSASPQPIPCSIPKTQVVASSNTSLPSSSHNTVFVQANRSSPQQVVRLITGQGSIQFPTYVAVPAVPPTLQQTSNSAQAVSVSSSISSLPIETALINRNVVKKTSHHVNSSCTTSSIISASNVNHKRRKRKDEETTKLDLANLIKISGIDEEDVGFVSTATTTPESYSSSPSPVVSLPSSSPTVPQFQKILDSSQLPHQVTIQQSQQKIIQSQHNSNLVTSRPSTPKSASTTPLLASIQTALTHHQLTIGEDGNVILQQPQFTSRNITTSGAVSAQNQLAQLVAEQSHVMKQTAVVSLTGSESVIVKTPTGYILRQQPSVVVQHSVAPNMVVTDSSPNGLRLLTDVSSIQELPAAGKLLVSSGSLPEQSRVQFVTTTTTTGCSGSAGTISPLTEPQTQQHRVQVADISSLSLTTEHQQNHVQILTSSSVPSSSLSCEQQQQTRTAYISSEPRSSAIHEQQSIQVIPQSSSSSTTTTISLNAEQLVADLSKQLLSTSVQNCSSSSNIHGSQNSSSRVIIHNNAERKNEQTQHLRISSSERTDVHITSNAIPTESVKQQAHLRQMIATAIPQNCTIALSEQNQIRLVPTSEYVSPTIEKQKSDLQNAKSQFIESLPNLKQATKQGDKGGNRIHLISNLDDGKSYMEVNEEHKRIIVEHQRVLNTSSTMALNDQPNHIQLITCNGAETQNLIQQLEEQTRFKFITPKQQQQTLLHQQECSSQQIMNNNHHQQLSKISIQINDLDDSCAKTRQQIAQNAPVEQSDKLPGVVPTSIHDVKIRNQNLFHSLKGRAHNVVVEDVAATKAVAVASRGKVACPPLSVINVQCAGPLRSPPPGHPSLNNMLTQTQCVTTSGFANPAATGEHQLSAAQPCLLSPMGQLNMIQGSKPCAAVASSSSVPQASGISTSETHVNQFLQERLVERSGEGLSPSKGQSSNYDSTTFGSPPQQHGLVHNSSLSNGAGSHNFLADSGSAAQSSNQNLSHLKTGIVPPCAKTNAAKSKKPKKSAIVKPMVFQPEDKKKTDAPPACLNPVAASDGSNSTMQRVQTIQLTPQKQQSLKLVQNQIAVLSGKKTRTPLEQAALQKLFNEQQKILMSGKIVPTVPSQNSQGLTFVSTPVRLVPPPCTTPSSPHPPSTPPTCNKATSPIHVQVGTQTSLDESMLDFSLPLPQVSIQSPLHVMLPSPTATLVFTSLPSVNSPTQVVKTTQPQALSLLSVGTQLSPHFIHPQLPQPSPPPPPSSLLSAEKRVALITEQLECDQRSVINPDTSTPFDSVSDACRRLLRYHCLDEPLLSEKDLEKADEIFEVTAKHLLDKNAQMLNKYRFLLCKESMREYQTSELIMLERLFVAGERQDFEQLKTAEANPNNSQTNSFVANNKLIDCSVLPSLEDDVMTSQDDDDCTAFDALMTSAMSDMCDIETAASAPVLNSCNSVVNSRSNKRENESMPDIGPPEIKKHCPDDEEINAQVQNAIDSILNLQRSDPATDEAVRSILPS